MTTLEDIPEPVWEYKLGNRSAVEWILDQYKEKKPKDRSIAQHFHQYQFSDYKVCKEEKALGQPKLP